MVSAYLPHSAEDRARMLEAVGAASVDDLFAHLPENLRLEGLAALPAGLTEAETRDHLQALAQADTVWGASSFVGAGFYRHHVPAAVRSIIGRSEFATSYTPYQAEVSQGTLEHIFEFQTAVCELTGLDVANASLWDGPSAAAEAAFLALRATGRDHIALSAALHPETAQVLTTYAAGPGFTLTTLPVDEADGRTPPPEGIAEGTGVVVVQQPNFFGVIEDTAAWAEVAHRAGALLAVVQNPVTLGVLEAPGVLGADIAVGDVQPLGNGLNFGGPSAGYMACRGALLRQLPGRLVGRTVDSEGRTCYTLTLQAREQHIRRAKATSNICSNQALNALATTVYLALLGPAGLRELGALCVQRAHALRERLTALPGIAPVFSGPFFHEFALRLPLPAGEFRRRLRAQGVDPGVPLGRWFPQRDRELLVAVTEVNSPLRLERYVEAAGRALTEGVAA